MNGPIPGYAVVNLDASYLVLPQLEIYGQISNLFNNKWINMDAFEGCSPEEQRKFVESGFEYLPSQDGNGAPILELAKFRNLPRSFVFGLTFEL